MTVPKPSSVMPETRAQRTLVKSPPELWAEISDAPSLARRLSAFGEVRITRKDPETAVAWEGASVRGTVELAASGWGTKVTIAAERTPEAPAAAEQETVTFDSAALAAALADEPAPEPAAAASTSEASGTDIPPPETRPAPREGFLARLKGWWHTGTWAPAPAAQPAPEPAPEPPAVQAPEVEPHVRAEPEPEPEPAEHPADPELEGLLVAVLDDLGSAHHRPFSRA